MKDKPIKILLIEDSTTDAMLLEESLRQVSEFSFAMDHAPGLKLGLHHLSLNTYDAVILDLGLPDSSGIRTFERIREQVQAMPIIIVSGNDDRALLTEALAKGADNYLIKESADGNRIAISILSAIRNRSAV